MNGAASMTATWTDYTPTRRDELISLARYGKITPDEAEAEAKASGFEPFARQPELPAFDPLQESRWTIVQSIAWIAWRDLKQVRENCAGFRSECRHWLWREWNEPVDNGTAFARRQGWFLEQWREATTVRLSMLENWYRSHEQLPGTRQMSVREAEKVLWRALGDGHLGAEALNMEGLPVDIPAREWSYLKLYEDGKRDVLRYDALDRREPFTEVKFRRDDLLRLWPAVEDRSEPSVASAHVEPSMLEPMEGTETAGYVPLCVALHWIATGAGTKRIRLDDSEAWAAAVAKLRPLLAGGEFEVIGVPRAAALAEPIPGTAFALLNILPPIPNAIGDILVSAPSHVDCSCYLGEENWTKHFNDRLWISGRPTPAWTHLQVRKADILGRWPRPLPTARPETMCQRWLADLMRENPKNRPKPKTAFRVEAVERFPGLALRQFQRAWDAAIRETEARAWSKSGKPKGSLSKSFHRTE
jgi:hypothetical protein